MAKTQLNPSSRIEQFLSWESNIRISGSSCGAAPFQQRLNKVFLSAISDWARSLVWPTAPVLYDRWRHHHHRQVSSQPEIVSSNLAGPIIFSFGRTIGNQRFPGGRFRISPGPSSLILFFDGSGFSLQPFWRLKLGAAPISSRKASY